MTTTHIVHEDHPWSEAVPNHPPRKDSPAYLASRKAMVAIVQQLGGSTFYGSGAIEDHHGGGCWLRDDAGWFLARNLAGCEWSSQFCADYGKLDKLRENARRLYAGFPQSVPALQALIGKAYDLQSVLDTPISDAPTAALFVDSLANASVPLPKANHTGIIEHGGHAGVHSYPAPVQEIEFFKHDTFTLWVTDAQGHPAAVLPMAPRGSGNAQVAVAYATPGSDLHTAHTAAHAKGEALIVDASHPLAQQAFAQQG